MAPQKASHLEQCSCVTAPPTPQPGSPVTAHQDGVCLVRMSIFDHMNTLPATVVDHCILEKYIWTEDSGDKHGMGVVQGMAC